MKVPERDFLQSMLNRIRTVASPRHSLNATQSNVQEDIRLLGSPEYQRGWKECEMRVAEHIEMLLNDCSPKELRKSTDAKFRSDLKR